MKCGMEKAYLAGKRECGFKAGDKVKVVFCPYKDDERILAGGWGVFWNGDMTKQAGKILTVLDVNGNSIHLSDDYYYPWFCLEKVADVAQERSFTPGDLMLVRDSLRDKWKVDKFVQYASGENYSVAGVFARWKFAIPLKGNEQLVGTIDAPEASPVTTGEETALAEKPSPVKRFAPFTKVLVRDVDAASWAPSFYGYFRPDNSYPYVCVGAIWRQCIPYEGNEHLLGTADKPE